MRAKSSGGTVLTVKVIDAKLFKETYRLYCRELKIPRNEFLRNARNQFRYYST